MSKGNAIAEVFVTAFKSLSETEKVAIVEKLLAELDKDFTQEEWEKIEKLANKKGKLYNTSQEFLKALNKI